MVKRFLWLIVMLTSALTTSPAQAQSGKWRTYYDSAKQAFKAERYADAIRLLEEAHRLSKQDQLLYNIAKASHFKFINEKQEEDLRRAVTSYQEYLAKVPDGRRRLEATRALGELEPQLPKEQPAADVDPDDPYGDSETSPKPRGRRTGVVVTTPAAGARITLDGFLRSGSPLVTETTPGMHTIFIEAPGFLPVRRHVRVDSGVELALDIQLSVLPANVGVEGPAGASVFMDGKHMGDLPLRGPLSIAPGDHFLAVTQNGRLAFTQSLLLDRGSGVQIAADLDMTNQRYAAYGMFGVSAVGLVVAAALTGATVDQQSTADDLQAERVLGGGVSVASADAFDDAVSKRDDFRTAAVTAFGLTATALTTGFFLYLFDEPVVNTPPRREHAPGTPAVPSGPGLEIGAAPIVTPYGGGAQLRLRY